MRVFYTIFTPFLPFGSFFFVLLEQQPFVFAGVDEHVVALKFFAGKCEFDELRVSFFQFMRTLVPDGDGARAVFALGNPPFEIGVVKLVVLDRECQPLDPGRTGRLLGHRPAFQHPVHLQPEVPVETGGPVFLDDESHKT